MSGVINTPEKLPRRRLHRREEEADGRPSQEADGITSSEEQATINNGTADEPAVEVPASALSDSGGEPVNPIAWFAPIFHLAMVVFYTLLLYYGITVMNEGIKIIDPTGRIPAYGGRFKFLTHINQWVQLFYFSVQFVTDILPKSSFKRIATKYVDIIFTTIAFPLAWFIVFTFWGIYAYDRQLVYPEAFDKVVPQWLNHFWHTTVGVFVLFEILLVFHRFPRSGLAASFCFIYNVAYIAWIGWIYGQTKFWVYPIIAVLPPPLLVLFFASCMFFSFGIFFAGKYISSLRWGPSTVY